MTDTYDRNMRYASILSQRHRQSCDEVGDRFDEVNTCFSIGADAIRYEVHHRGRERALDTQMRSEVGVSILSARNAHSVNWERLGLALKYYQANGYDLVEVPCIVSPEISAVTCPSEKRSLQIPGHGVLVGSAEQSFLMLDKAGMLGRGSFVAITPCFRHEGSVDKFHQKMFMKVELYTNTNVNAETLDRMIDQASAFFSSIAGKNSIQRLNTDDGVDLLLNDIEVGSYGIRSHVDQWWIYGTGLAEPRFSVAMKQ